MLYDLGMLDAAQVRATFEYLFTSPLMREF
jgi:hypothetical protein